MIDLDFRPQDMSGTIACLEVYKTDEENFTPYVSSNNLKSITKEKEEEKNTPTNLDTILSNNETFTLHQGKVLETYTYNNLFSIEWSKDYDGVSGEARVTIPFHKQDLNYIYKGVRCLIRCDRYNYNEILTAPVSETFECFVTDVKISQNSLEISLSSFDKLLEQQVQVSFSQMLRSQIIKEVIKMSGFKPIINIKGLKDEVMDYTNVSSNKNNSNSDNSTGEPLFGNDCTPTNSMACMSGGHQGNAGTGKNFDSCWNKKGYAKKGTNYYEWAQQFNDVKSMLIAFRKRWHYISYWNNRSCPEKVFAQGGGNCYDSCRTVLVLCMSRGFPCVIVTGNINAGGHGWNCIKVNGEWKTFDMCYTSRMGQKGNTNEAGF